MTSAEPDHRPLRPDPVSPRLMEATSNAEMLTLCNDRGLTREGRRWLRRKWFVALRAFPGRRDPAGNGWAGEGG